MAAKTVQVRHVGDTTWLTLPGNTADINITKASVDDSVFGSVFVSNFPTLKSWTTSSNAMLRGVAGYKAQVKRAGTPTAVTGGDLDNEINGGFYVSNRAQSLWDSSVAITIYNDSVEVTADEIEYIDYLQGGVVFTEDFVPGTAITADFSYLGTERICSFTSFDLGQTMATEDITDFCNAEDNGGWSVFAPQQLEVDLSLDGFYSDTSTAYQDIISDDVVIVELDLTGDGSAVARGYFRTSDLAESGDVGSTETSALSFTLAVPEGITLPFSYYIAENSIMPEAVRVCLAAWKDRVPVEFRYAADGSALENIGEAFVTDASLSNSVSDMNTFSLSFQGTDALVRS